jgi:hypothetical protein
VEGDLELKMDKLKALVDLVLVEVEQILDQLQDMLELLDKEIVAAMEQYILEHYHQE